MTGLGGERVVVVDMVGLGDLPFTRVTCGPPWLLVTENDIFVVCMCDKERGQR